MTQYKIQLGSWTKLPEGKVQVDTRDIMKMMAEKVCGDVESHVAKVGSFWDYIGVYHDHTILVYHSAGDYTGLVNQPSLFIPYEELQKMLNTPVETPQGQGMPKVSSLLNTKLDCRKADGTVDEELSRAFQEACFEQGIVWGTHNGFCKHLDKHFLYTNKGRISFSNKEGVNDTFFERRNNKQINFKYSRTLIWEATVVEPATPEPADEMVDICGVEYSAKGLSEALALIKSARKV